MGMLRRLQILTASTVSIGMVAIIYARLQDTLIEPAKEGGKYEGFLSQRVAEIDAVAPIVLALLLLGIVIWFMVATVQRERTERGKLKQPPR